VSLWGDAAGLTNACLNVRYAESSDGGKTWSSSIQISDAPTNPNYEPFSSRRAPFFGDYITVAAQRSTIGAGTCMILGRRQLWKSTIASRSARRLRVRSCATITTGSAFGLTQGTNTAT
jgi:hypothetical protein